MKYIFIVLAVLCVFSCSTLSQNTPTKQKLSDEELLTLVQEKTCQYFLDGAEPNSGMARERYHMNDIYSKNDKHVVTSGGAGFGLMAILVAIERDFISREAGLKQLERIVGFLETADRFHGAWSHWIDGETGKVVPFGWDDNGGDLVETAFMIQGLLCVRQYFQGNNKRETELRKRINKLWLEVEWDWYRRDGQNVLYWHWSPDYGWKKNFAVTGYNECLIMYVLAASSPTHTIPPEVYHEGWARNGKMAGKNEKYGYTLTLNHNGAQEYGGPLFWSHYSFLGLDPRKLKDRYADYWEHNRNHVLIDYEYCVENPKKQLGFGPNCWGLTASYTHTGYGAACPGRENGVIAPTAALASFPYSPKESMQAMRYFYEVHGDRLFGPYGFYDAFNLRMDWFPQRYLAIDQGPIPVMIENYRSGLLWDLFMSCPEIQVGLDKLGFEYE
jgi:hypothetical protein